MNAAWTYTTLRQALQDWPVNTNTSYVNNLDKIIALGELRCVRDLNLEVFEIVEELTMTLGTRELDKPASLLVLQSMRLNAGVSTAAPYKALNKRSYDFCVLAHPSIAAADRAEPEMYAELNATQWYLAPSPDAAYKVTVRYTARPTGLTSSAATSWLGTNVPDLLFAACLMESEHFIKADDRYEDWKRKYAEEILPTTRFELRSMIRDGAYTPYKPAAVPAQG